MHLMFILFIRSLLHSHSVIGFDEAKRISFFARKYDIENSGWYTYTITTNYDFVDMTIQIFDFISHIVEPTHLNELTHSLLFFHGSFSPKLSTKDTNLWNECILWCFANHCQSLYGISSVCADSRRDVVYSMSISMYYSRTAKSMQVFFLHVFWAVDIDIEL